jgi:hypothetical protein
VHIKSSVDSRVVGDMKRSDPPPPPLRPRSTKVLLRGVFRDLTLARVASNENGSVCLSHGMGLWVMRLQLTTLVGKDWQRGKHTFFFLWPQMSKVSMDTDGRTEGNTTSPRLPGAKPTSLLPRTGFGSSFFFIITVCRNRTQLRLEFSQAAVPGPEHSRPLDKTI